MNRAAAGNIASASNIEQAGGVYRRLLRYARPYTGVYLLGVIGMMMYAGTDLLTISFTKTYLQNSMALERNHQLLRWLPFWVLGIFLFRGAGDYLANYFPFWVGRQVIKAIRTDLFAHYLRLPTAIYDRESSGTMLSRLTYNAETVAAATTDSLTVIIRDSLSIAFNIGALFWLNWKLAIYALLVAPAIAWLVRSVNVRFRRYSARIQNSMEMSRASSRRRWTRTGSSKSSMRRITSRSCSRTPTSLIAAPTCGCPRPARAATRRCR